MKFSAHKWTALAVLALGFIGCGFPKQMAKDCGGSLEMGCRTLFGEPEQDNDDLDRRVTDLEVRMRSLELTVGTNSALIGLLQTNTVSLQAQITALQSQSSSNQAAISILQGQLATTNAQIVNLQTQTNVVQASVTAIAAQDSVIDYLDCGGDGPGYDEIVLRTRSGRLVAYFESGGNRFLSTLVQGSYSTTDGQACHFSVNSSGQFCDSLGCR